MKTSNSVTALGQLKRTVSRWLLHAHTALPGGGAPTARRVGSAARPSQINDAAAKSASGQIGGVEAGGGRPNRVYTDLITGNYAGAPVAAGGRRPVGSRDYS